MKPHALTHPWPLSQDMVRDWSLGKLSLRFSGGMTAPQVKLGKKAGKMGRNFGSVVRQSQGRGREVEVERKEC